MIYRQNIVLKRFNSIAQQVRTEEMCKNLLRMFFWHDYTPVKKRSIFTWRSSKKSPVWRMSPISTLVCLAHLVFAKN